MKIPRYYLSKQLQLEDITFPPWTEVRPIEDYLLPEHKKEELEEATKYSVIKMKMCIIGIKWVLVPESYIIERI